MSFITFYVIFLQKEDDKYKKVHTKAKKVAGDVGHSGNLQAILNRVKDRRSELGPAGR